MDEIRGEMRGGQCKGECCEWRVRGGERRGGEREEKRGKYSKEMGKEGNKWKKGKG